MLLLKNGFLEKIETWHVGLSCQYTHFMSFSSKSEHDTVADQATLITLVENDQEKQLRKVTNPTCKGLCLDVEYGFVLFRFVFLLH